MLIVLPNKVSDLRELEERLLDAGLASSKLLEKLEPRDVLLALPKFRISFNTEMSEILEQVCLAHLNGIHEY